MGITDWALTQLPGLGLGAAATIAAWFGKTWFEHRRDEREQQKAKREVQQEDRAAQDAKAEAWRSAFYGITAEKEILQRRVADEEQAGKDAQAQAAALQRQLEHEKVSKSEAFEKALARFVAMNSALLAAIKRRDVLNEFASAQSELLKRRFCEAFDLDDAGYARLLQGALAPDDDPVQQAKQIGTLLVERSRLIAQNVLYRTFDHFVFLSDIGRIALQNTQANAAEFEALIQTLIDEYNAGKFDKPPVFSIHP